MFTVDNRIDATMPKLLLNYLFSSRLPMFADAYSEMKWGISVLPVRSVSAFPCNCLRNNRVEFQTLTIVPIKIIECSLDIIRLEKRKGTDFMNIMCEFDIVFIIGFAPDLLQNKMT